MSGLAFAKSFRDLIVYQKAKVIAKKIFILTKAFPREEMYSLTDQVRRSSRSVGGQISEAWAKRRYPNHFLSKLSDADGEQSETQHWIDTALDCEYIDPATAKELLCQLDEVGRMLNRMMERAEGFCGHKYDRVKEEQTPYGTSNEFFVISDHHTDH